MRNAGGKLSGLQRQSLRPRQKLSKSLGVRNGKHFRKSCGEAAHEPDGKAAVAFLKRQTLGVEA
jgi:hypothetical protein